MKHLYRVFVIKLPLIFLVLFPSSLAAQTTPTITWDNPADIVVGTVIGPAQLNATASVPGTFEYHPDAGSTMFGGDGQSLFVFFRPTDSVNYTTAMKTVPINVLEGHISGTITIPAGLPQVFGTVSVYDVSGNLVRTASSFYTSDTSYSVKGIPDGSYFVKLSEGPVYVDQLYDGVLCPSSCNVTLGTPVAVSLGATTSNINFTLIENGSVSGTVTGTGGVPVQFMTVSAFNASGALAANATTTANGSYKILGLSPGAYFIRSESALTFVGQLYPGLSCPSICDVTAGTPVPVVYAATTPNINFAPAEYGSVSGRVTDTSGTPLQGIAVAIFSASGTGAANTASTNSSGVFSFGRLAPGTYYARTINTPTQFFGYLNQLYNGGSCAFSCNVTSGTPIPVSAGALTPNINFALPAEGRVSGTMTLSGVPLSGAFVQIYNSAGVIVRDASTDNNGFYTVRGLPTDTYFALGNKVFAPVVPQLFNGIACQGCVVTSGAPIAVTQGATTPNINFSFSSSTAGVGITGKVTLAGGILASNLMVEAQSASGFPFRVTPNSNGTYAITGLTPGSYFVHTIGGNLFGLIDQLYSGIPCQGCNVATGTPVSVDGLTNTPNINFSLAAGGRITGIVRDANGVPLQDVTVQVYDSNGNLVSTSFSTGSNGAFNTPGLLAGLYFLRTSNGRGYLDQVYSGVSCEFTCNVTTGTPISVTLGTTVANINFALPIGGIISGAVVDQGGLGVPNATIQLFDASGNLRGSTLTLSDGGYSIRNISPGTYFARTANSPPYVEQLYNRAPCEPGCVVTAGKPITVTAGGTTSNILFVLSEGGRISGQVTLSGRTDMSGATVEIYNASGLLVRTANTNAGGRYTATGLASGSYYARTRNNFSYVDQLYGGGSCVSCVVTAGAPITVSDLATASDINFTLASALTSIVPGNVGQGAIISVTLTGNNLAAGMTIDAGAGATFTDVAVQNPTSATATLRIASNATLGVRDVRITISGVTSNAVPITVVSPRLSVRVSGPGSGRLTSDGKEIDCGTTCSTSFTSGQVFRLTATPAAGSIFAGWSGDADCLDGNVTMMGALNCLARFDIPLLDRRDFDGDGKTDILWRDAKGNVTLSLMNGQDISSSSFIANIWIGWGIVGTGDFNGDSKPDILWRDPSGNLAIWLMDGINVAGYNSIGNVPATSIVAGIADFNGDGKTDILWRDSVGNVSMWIMNGYAITSNSFIANIWPGWVIVGTGDFNGDGKPDILWRDSSGNLAIWLMDGTVVSGYSSIGNVPMTSTLAGIADFNGDRKSDILWRDNLGNVILWTMNSYAINANTLIANISAGWTIIGNGDYNGDGKADILWRDASQNVAIWTMDGATVSSWSSRGNVSDRMPQ
jgi:protocatechuate 3,4-dioxygenase beta subunit